MRGVQKLICAQTPRLRNFGMVWRSMLKQTPPRRALNQWLLIMGKRIILTLAGVLSGVVTFAADSDTYSVRDFGAKDDGKTDDPAAFQKALDAAGKAGGGVERLLKSSGVVCLTVVLRAEV